MPRFQTSTRRALLEYSVTRASFVCPRPWRPASGMLPCAPPRARWALLRRARLQPACTPRATAAVVLPARGRRAVSRARHISFEALRRAGDVPTGRVPPPCGWTTRACGRLSHRACTVCSANTLPCGTLSFSARVVAKGVPISLAFQMWTQKEEIPLWMPWIESVKVRPAPGLLCRELREELC